MARNIDLTDPNIIQTILSEIENTEELDRKTASFDSWQIYSGNQKPYVEKELKRTRPKSWKTYSISDISVAKVVVDKLSKSYKQQPIREVQKGQKNDRLMEIYDQGDFKVQLPFCDKLLNLHKYALMWVTWRADEERYQFMSLQPHEFSVIRNKDTGELGAVILNYGNTTITSNAMSGDGYDGLLAESQADSSAQSKVYAMWSKENFVVIESEAAVVMTMKGEQIKRSITFVDIPDNPLNINPLGMIPFVWVSKEPSIDYPTTNPLAEQSVVWNALNSEGLTASNIQGTGQMVISYPEKYEGKFKNLTQGLTTAIKLPQSDNPDDRDTTVSYINPNPDLAGQREYYDNYLKQIVAQQGITNAQGIQQDSQSAASGVSMMIQNADVQDIIEMNQDLFVDMEQKMFEIIKTWEVFLGFNTYSEDDELNIKFKKPKMLVTDSEKLTNIEKMLQLGMIEEYEKLMMIDPNLTEEQAKEKLEKIKKEKMDNIKNSPLGMMNGRQGSEEAGSGLEPGAESEQEPSEE